MSDCVCCGLYVSKLFDRRSLLSRNVWMYAWEYHLESIVVSRTKIRTQKYWHSIIGRTGRSAVLRSTVYYFNSFIHSLFAFPRSSFKHRFFRFFLMKMFSFKFAVDLIWSCSWNVFIMKIVKWTRIGRLAFRYLQTQRHWWSIEAKTKAHTGHCIWSVYVNPAEIRFR